MEKIILRECKEEDIPQILKIENESFSHPYSRETFMHFLGNPSFLVAEDKEENEILGYIIAETRVGRTLIVSIAVSKAHRFKGIGTALMKEIEERHTERPFLLTLRVDNEGAYEFYKKLGYNIVDLLERYYENGQDAYLMQKL